jgi:polyhydroxyalkanoate synthase
MEEALLGLSKIRMLVYLTSNKTAHLAPWKSTCSTTQLYSGTVEFVVLALAYIVVIFNPQSDNKYYYWTNYKKLLAANDWFDETKINGGLWCGDGLGWISEHIGIQVKDWHREMAS